MKNVVCAFVLAGTASTAAFAADRIWTGNAGDTLWITQGNWEDNAPPLTDEDVAIFPAGTPALVRINQNATARTLRFHNPGMTVTIDSGAELFLSHHGALVTRAEENASIIGGGTLRFSAEGDGSSQNWADNQAALGKTLTIGVKIVGPYGFEHNGTGGTIALTSLVSTYEGIVTLTGTGALEVPVLANRNVDGPLGKGNTVRFAHPSTLRYTGAGDSTDRDFLLHTENSQDAIIEHAGTGTLAFTGPFASGTDRGHAFNFRVLDPAAVIDVSGTVGNGALGQLWLWKTGAGELRISGTGNTYTGETQVEAGTLTFATANAISAASPIRLRGGRLSLPDGAAAGALLIDGSGAGTVVEVAPGAASVSFASLQNISGTVDFSAVGLGTTTKIFITVQQEGLIGPWATVNGGSALAAYSRAQGVHAAVIPSQTLQTHGPAAIANAPDGAARVTGTSSGSGIPLSGNPTEIAILSHEVNAAALVNFGGSELIATTVQIAPAGGDLTLGTVPGDGALTAPERLTLANAHPAGGTALTVNAAIQDNGATPVRLDKTGTGDVTIAGGITHIGGTHIESGTLTVSYAADMDWPEGGISGSGGLTLTGSGSSVTTVTFPDTANTYAGTTTITRGTALIRNSSTFGSADGPTIVRDGGSIDFTGINDNNSVNIGAEQVYAEGVGPDGLGALRNTGPYFQHNAMRNLKLTGPLTVYSPSRFDLRNNGGSSTLDLNGYGITKKGGDMFALTAVTVTNSAQNASVFNVEEGVFSVEVNTVFPGGDENRIDVATGATFDLYMLYAPLAWRLNFAPDSFFNLREGIVTNHNVMAGPVSLAGPVTFRSPGNFLDTWTGSITGAGPLIKDGATDAITYLYNPNNNWTDGTIISNANLYAAEPGALPKFATDVTVHNRGTLILRVAGAEPAQTGFTPAQISSVVNNGTTFAAPTAAAIGFDAAFGDADYPHDIPEIGIRKSGPGTLTLSGAGPNLGPVRVTGGTLDLSPADRYLGENTISIGNTASASAPLAALTVGGSAQITSFDRGSTVEGQPAVIAGDTGRGVIRLSDSAKIKSRLMVGNAAAAHGAVYQTGGTFHNTGGASNDGRIGLSGYGYYQLAGGSLINNGYSHLAWMPSSIGILEQTDGSFTFTGEYQGNFGISRGGDGVMHLAGGAFHSVNALKIGDPHENGVAGGSALLTVTSNATVTITGTLDIGGRSDMTDIVNFNGGTLEAKGIWRDDARTGSLSLINWNGGVFRLGEYPNADLFAGTLRPTVLAYERGVAIDVPESSMRLSVNAPLRAPTGLGILTIPVIDGGSGYIGSPLVRISGGDGTGASAFAHINTADGSITGIEVTSPGTGFSSAPTVTLAGGSPVTPATLGTPTLGMNASGGLTKLGIGTLTLSAANTYTGLTDVQAGTLRLNDPDALPPFSPLSVSGGILDLGGNTVTNTTVSVTGGGIINGRIAAAALDKDGPGTFTLSGPLTLSTAEPPRTLTPGLWEGMIRSNWDMHTPNPRHGIQLTTRAANGGVQAGNNTYAGGLWAGDYHTWVYTGYIWNHQAAPVDWSFFGRFDDNIMLSIDGKLLINSGNGSDVFITYTLTPGPHVFEARFGDGVGEVGPGPNDRAVRPGTGPMSGLLVNYAGDGSTDLSSYEILLDDGHGSLFTIDIPESPDGPGLAESLVHAVWNTESPGLLISRQPTTRAANGGIQASNATYADGLWAGNNHTWVYSGYIWNRGPAQDWSFLGRFDDHVRLTLDGQVVFDGGNEVDAIATRSIATGHHAIEIRFGDGEGDVGPGGSPVLPSGLVVDYEGRGSYDRTLYQPLEAEGGLRLTTDIPSGEKAGQPVPERVAVNINGGILRVNATATPGLIEGRLSGSFNTTDPNPGGAIEPSTTAANGNCGEDGSINGKHWPNTSTYVYTGYIWNRAPTNEVWTFAENFDDNVRLIIGDATIIENGIDWSTPTVANATLKPGANFFEVRFGQGGGGAGAALDGENPCWWDAFTNRDRSFAVDFKGRGSTDFTHYEIPMDDGLGTLFTVDTIDAQTASDFLATAEVNLAAAATLDLCGSSQTVALLTGTGTVSNGTFLAGSVISPAGDAATGTLTLEGVTFASGAICRLTAAGALCDRLISTGALNLAGLTLIPVDPAAFTAPKYVIARADGGITGAKPALSGFPSKYRIIQSGNELWLTSLGGTLMILK